MIQAREQVKPSGLAFFLLLYVLVMPVCATTSDMAGVAVVPVPGVQPEGWSKNGGKAPRERTFPGTCGYALGASTRT
jgi:hypothetical protein